jgi:hypothetical protein
MPAAGPRALALAVYSDSSGELTEARESGVEGVACVDDAARACVLLCKLWAATGNDALRRWAEGLLDFIIWMHYGDGRWVNFVYDWEGTKNTDGPTSEPGVNYWQARATYALAEAKTLFGDGHRQIILEAALSAAASGAPPSDIRAVHALSALPLLARAPDPWLSSCLSRWCDELAACQRDGMLMNSPDEIGQPHLWGHVQEAVLADASVVFGSHQFRRLAVSSAEAVFAAAIESGFDLPHIHAYDVQSAAFVMDRLAAATGQRRHAELAQKARDWFDGRNPAGAGVYNRASGRVADGIDNGVLNDRSGAEATISAGLALIDDPLVVSAARDWRRGGGNAFHEANGKTS